MRARILNSVAVLISALLVGCAAQPVRERLVVAQTVEFSDVVAKADRLVSQAKLTWGQPTEVRWQFEPLNRYVVIYPTPAPELGLGGYRAVHVSTNGDTWFVPRL